MYVCSAWKALAEILVLVLIRQKKKKRCNKHLNNVFKIFNDKKSVR